MKSVTVIIPAYNEELTIRRAVRSVLSQGEQVSCVVVDDASTDKTAERARQAGAVVIQREKNAGVAEAINTALDAGIDTDYIGVMGADDWLELNGLGQLVHRLTPNQFGFGVVRYWGAQNGFAIPNETPDFYAHNAGTMCVYHRQWVERGMRYHTFDAGYGFEDWDWALQLCDAGAEPVPVRDVLVYNYIYNPSVSLHGETMKREADFMREMKERHPKLKVVMA